MFWLGRFSGLHCKLGSKALAGSTTLRVECLEARLAPVVGAFKEPEVIAPKLEQTPTQYDGVVEINSDGTGALIATRAGWSWGHQILTAAHVFTGKAAIPVRFDLQREGNPIPIEIQVPAGSQYQTPHSLFDPNNALRPNDIALLVLTDQVKGLAAPDRLLVAPFSAQQYSLYNEGIDKSVGGVAPEVGKQFTVVGYGLTGTGQSGQEAGTGRKNVSVRIRLIGAVESPRT